MILKQLNSRDASKFNELYIKLTKRRVITKRWSIIYLLYKLQEDPASSPFNSLNGPLEAVTYKPIREPIEEGNIQIEPSKPVEAKRLHFSSEDSEADLIRDMLFTFQGIDGRYITFSLLEDCYVIQPNLFVSDSVRRMVSEL